MLGHLKMPFEEIKQALLSMDEKKFSEAHLKQLLIYAPDSKEVRTTRKLTMLDGAFWGLTDVLHNKALKSKLLRLKLVEIS